MLTAAEVTLVTELLSSKIREADDSAASHGPHFNKDSSQPIDSIAGHRTKWQNLLAFWTQKTTSPMNDVSLDTLSVSAEKEKTTSPNTQGSDKRTLRAIMKTCRARSEIDPRYSIIASKLNDICTPNLERRRVELTTEDLTMKEDKSLIHWIFKTYARTLETDAKGYRSALDEASNSRRLFAQEILDEADLERKKADAVKTYEWVSNFLGESKVRRCR